MVPPLILLIILSSNVTSTIRVMQPARAKILGEDTLADSTTYTYLVKTSPGKMNHLWNSTFAGDLKPFRDLLDNCVADQTITLNSTGDYTEEVDFGKLDPGDYLVLATLNKSTAPNITLTSTAAFEVFEYGSTLEVTKIDEMYVEGTLTINATLPHTYNYVAALIGKDEAFDLRLEHLLNMGDLLCQVYPCSVLCSSRSSCSLLERETL